MSLQKISFKFHDPPMEYGVRHFVRTSSKSQKGTIRFRWLFPWHLGFSCALYLIPYTIYFTSCGNGDVKPKKEIDPSQFKEQLVKVNKYEVEKELDEINQYIVRHNWKMEKTGTGLRYMLVARKNSFGTNGNGIQPHSGDFVKVNYKISLLDGTECYSSDKDGAKDFKVEGEDIENGLHEAVLLMHTGDKAKFILPSYRAHGLHGDDEKIPPLSAIVVDLELLQVN